MDKLIDILDKGDLRSAADHESVSKLVKDQAGFDELFEFLEHHDRKLVMHAADAVEKITITHPQYLQKHKNTLARLCRNASNKEVKWHLAQLVARVNFAGADLNNIWSILKGWSTDKTESRIVRVFSLQTLFDWSISHGRQKEVEQLMNDLTKENIPSINSRIRKLKAKIKR